MTPDTKKLEQRARDIWIEALSAWNHVSSEAAAAVIQRALSSAAEAKGGEPVAWVSPFGPCVCSGDNACPGCNPNEAIALAREIAANDERRKHAPCIECGAATAKEAETKCLCSGDKDDCHGCQLWPDGQDPRAADEADAQEVKQDSFWTPDEILTVTRHLRDLASSPDPEKKA